MGLVKGIMKCEATNCKKGIFGAAQPFCEKHRILEKAILKFIRLRNSSEFDSNLQFQLDMDAAELKLKDIGKAVKFTDFDKQEVGWCWETPFGTLKEAGGKMSLHRNLLTRKQSEKMNKAISKVFKKALNS